VKHSCTTQLGELFPGALACLAQRTYRRAIILTSFAVAYVWVAPAQAQDTADVQISASELHLLDPDRRNLVNTLSGVTGQTSPEQVADLAWRVTFTTCTRSGSSAPSYFQAGRRQTNHYSFPVQWTLIERSGSFVPLPGKPLASEPLSEADHRNGIQWRGKAYLKVSAAREFEFNRGGGMNGGPWSRWIDGDGRAWSSGPDLPGRSNDSNPTLALEKKNDQWWINGLTASEYARLAGRFKLSCETATAPDPFATLDGKTTTQTYDPLTDEAKLAREMAAQKTGGIPAGMKTEPQITTLKYLCSGTRAQGSAFTAGPRSLTITSPTKITRLRIPAGAANTAEVQLEGVEGLFRVPADQVKDSCRP